MQQKAEPTQKITIPGRDDLTDIAATPGGTVWATTPGGTRIKYDRNVMLYMRNSPHAKTPPAGMSAIPGITGSAVSTATNNHPISNSHGPHATTSVSLSPNHTANRQQQQQQQQQPQQQQQKAGKDETTKDEVLFEMEH